MTRAVITYVSIVVVSLAALFRTRREQAVVELALRQQLAIYTQKLPRPRLTAADRGFWVALLRLWPRWRSILVIVRPETVLRWHRKGFRLYWRSRSRPGPGRPPISSEVQELSTYWVHIGIDSIEEAAYWRKGADEDELWVSSEHHGGLAVRDACQGTPNNSAAHLLTLLFAARVGHGWPTRYVISSPPSLIHQSQFEALVQQLEADLQDAADRTTAETPEIVSVARGLELNPRPAPEAPGSWKASCPGTNHALYLSNNSNEFTCPYCKRKGGPTELSEFVVHRRRLAEARQAETRIVAAENSQPRPTATAKAVHVILSEAGEPEAGPTEFDERVVDDEELAQQAVAELEEACERFIESQAEIISANEEMRRYNESMYGFAGGGYFYRVYWLAFPNPPKSLTTADQLMSHYFGDGDVELSSVEHYLRRQIGHDSNDEALTRPRLSYRSLC